MPAMPNKLVTKSSLTNFNNLAGATYKEAPPLDEFSARVRSCRAGLGVVDAYVAELFGKLQPLIATTAEEAEAARRKRNRAGILQH